MNLGVNVGYHSGVYAGVTQRVLFAKLDIGALYDMPHEDVMLQLRMGFGHSWQKDGVAEHALYGFAPMLNFSTDQMGYNTPFGIEYVFREYAYFRIDVYADCLCPNIGINVWNLFAQNKKSSK